MDLVSCAGFFPAGGGDPQSLELPTVVITSVSVDEANAAHAVIDAGYSNTKLPIGAAVALGIELQLQGQRVRSFNEEYAIPMRSTERMMRIINIAFRDGSARFTAEMNDSKRWEVTRELINSGLPAKAHMDFAGIGLRGWR